jgi:hypothetical protein
VTDVAYESFFAGVLENIRAYTSGEPVRVINEDVLGSTQQRANP